MQSEIIVNEWNIINTNEDIKNVSRAALGFHDSVVEKINKINYSNIVEVIFNTTWDCKIIIRFDEVEFRCAEEYGRMGEIFEGALFFEKGFIYWVDCNIDNSQDISEEMCFFKSKKASWKIEVV